MYKEIANIFCGLPPFPFPIAKLETRHINTGRVKDPSEYKEIANTVDWEVMVGLECPLPFVVSRLILHSNVLGCLPLPGLPFNLRMGRFLDVGC